MDLNAVQMFVGVVRAGSLSAAALRMGVPLPTLSRLILSLEPRGWEARKAIVHDQFDNTVTMKFTKMVVNSGLPERTFTFVAPKGVAIVPLR